ncbi:hypothetical protein WN55_05698 [Dufourea novaeangliae]|uniref:Uncharacterized protein n=1 Tax=Dufourea novaeangliae TaxID=178035 RepID=A0A154PPH0_DUFNO|nr:hypothetical protein WN55_05698 [Dufourea novaeangliae]
MLFEIEANFDVHGTLHSQDPLNARMLYPVVSIDLNVNIDKRNVNYWKYDLSWINLI